MTKKRTYELGIVAVFAGLLGVGFDVLYAPPDWAAAGFTIFTAWVMMLKIGQRSKG